MNPYFMIFLLLVAFYFLYLFYNDNNSSNTTKKIETILNPIDRCSQLYDRERVYEFDNLLTSQECNQIIEMAKPNISKSTVLSDEGTHSGRTSSHIFLKSTTELLQKIDTIVYNYLQIPIENYEDLQVVNYKSTQKYDAHYDACDPDEEICKNDIKTLGSLRYATFIFYLNDNFTGGETDFPHKNIKANPKVGKGVLFFNLNDDNTNRRHNSYHAGLPPTTGEKWMSNKWIRLKKIPWK